METRKIQQVGGGTYTVSIPVQWANDHDIEAGNTAYLYTHRDGSLVVRWNEKEHSELATTDIELDDTAPEVAERMLVAAYSAGFKKIQLRNSEGLSSAQRRAIDTCTRGLTGVEITEESTHHVTVQGLLDASDVSIRQSTIQLQYITLSMYQAALDFFAGESTESEHIITRDDEADRIFHLITRHFNRSLLDLAELDQLGITRPQLFEYYVTARQLERIADHAAKIARCVQRTEYTVSEELVTESRAIGENARQIVEDASGAVINAETTGMAHSALEDCEHVVQAARNLDRSLPDRPPEEAYVLTRVLDSIIRTAEYGGNIAEIALRISLRD
ncbi:phosphate uptake regulator PhoU (plasmid) [Halorussus limi]|uniref:Phosphate uptake regulator PhoU n=1 Tax=Halorussus limi TaxID=2938695 RepID=A0A8U0I0T9_9EURY|nr:phosphate uptake regulator PhoU [Halorussus limi]UPV77042.1 phosphate uptake regulator PhoU [Halorussus limi]